MPPMNPTFLEWPTIAASAPTRNEPSSSRNLSAARLGGGGMGCPALSVATEKSTPAKSVFGYSLASWMRSSVKMNPMPITSFMPSAARMRSPASRSDPSPGSMNRTWTPSSFSARSPPRYAASLNDLSPRPPTSNTMPTFTALGSMVGETAPAGCTKSNTTWAASSAPTRMSSFRMA